MKLFIAVPKQSRQTDSQTVTSPARTRQWISRLPLLDTRESLLQIHGALYGTNRTELKPGQRLKLLDAYRSPLRVIRGQVESQLSRGAAPLAADDLTIAGLFRDCCVELAYGYKIIVLDIAQSRKRRQVEDMRLSMARAIFYLEQTIFACALFHQTPPAGIWQEIHTLYYYARSLGMADEPIRDPVLKGRSATTISLVYRRALLFGLSDPFHQPIPLMTRVLDFLKHHVEKTRIKSYSRPRTKHCQFVIDPQSDHPARAYVKNPKHKPPRDALLLDTVDMTRHAHNLLKRINSAREVDIELDSEFQDKLGMKLLQEVVHSWAAIPEREEERSRNEQEHVELVSGMERVVYCINGESAFETSSPDHARRDSAGGALAVHAPGINNGDFERLSCLIVDHADSGLRVSIPYERAAPGSFRVGDLVATRRRDSGWTAGSIRWIRCLDSSIQLGIKQLPRGLEPAAIKPVSTDREAPFRTGLMITPRDNPDTTPQLIAPAGLYQRQRNLFVDNGETLLMVRTRRMIERGQTVEWFECENLNL